MGAVLDLPPGTGDIAISTAQLIPNAELLVVTTPQTAAAEVAERAGSIALQTRQRIVFRRFLRPNCWRMRTQSRRPSRALEARVHPLAPISAHSARAYP